jgi:hypothetical protein
MRLRNKIITAAVAAVALPIGIAMPSYAVYGGCFPAVIGSANYGNSSTWRDTTLGGTKETMYHTNMTHSGSKEIGVFISGIKVSSGEDNIHIFNGWGISRRITYQWAYGESSVASCYYYST